MTYTIPNIYRLGVIALNGGSTTYLVGVTNATVNYNVKITEDTAAGALSPSYASVMEASPHISATVYDIGTLIGNGVGTSPLPINASATITSVALYGVQTEEDGTIASGSVHALYTVSQGIMLLTAASAKQGQNATATIEIHAETVDGTTDPIVFTGSNALPSPYPTMTQCFTVGQVEINGGIQYGINSIDYQAGFKVEKSFSNGSVFSTNVYVSEYKPKVTLGYVDATQVSTFQTNSQSNVGAALGSSSFVAYFQKLANLSTRVAAGTAAHVKIAGSASQAMIVPDTSSLQMANGEARLTIHPVVGSSNPVIALSVAAIT